MAASPRILLTLAVALLCACVVAVRRPPPPSPPVVAEVEAVRGERHPYPLRFHNSSCQSPISYTVSTEADWVHLDEPATVSGLAPGARAVLPVELDLTDAAEGVREARLSVSCPTCPAVCSYPREIVLRVAVVSHRLPALDLTLDLFQDFVEAGAGERLRDAHPAEVFAVLTATVPGFQAYLVRLRRELGAEARIWALAPGEGTAALPQRWPLPEAPPMLLQTGDVDLVVELHPAAAPQPARLAQPGAAAGPAGPPPLVYYQVDPERWPRTGGVRHLLCSEPATLRRVVGKLTYGDGSADRREERIEADRWVACPVSAGGGSVRGYVLEQPARRKPTRRVVVASAYFLDVRTQAGPVISVPLWVE